MLPRPARSPHRPSEHAFRDPPHTSHVGPSVLVRPGPFAARRTLTIDPATAAALRAWRARQTRERLEMGAGWTDTGFVFTEPDGTPIKPAKLSATFTARAQSADVPPIRLHDVRHSYAAAALAAGESYKLLQERLGHATASQTLDIYSHVSAEVEEAAANRIAASILGGEGR